MQAKFLYQMQVPFVPLRITDKDYSDVQSGCAIGDEVNVLVASKDKMCMQETLSRIGSIVDGRGGEINQTWPWQEEATSENQ